MQHGWWCVFAAVLAAEAGTADEQHAADRQPCDWATASAEHDPWPVSPAGGFGEAEGLARSLDTDSCDQYVLALKAYATHWGKRHASYTFLNEKDCTFTKVLFGPATVRAQEMRWTAALSGNPHFVTLLAKHEECSAFVLAKLPEESADFSLGWLVYKRQLDEIVQHVVDKGIMPADVTMSQVLMAGSFIVLTDYEIWTLFQNISDTDVEMKGTRPSCRREGEFLRLESELWVQWMEHRISSFGSPFLRRLQFIVYNTYDFDAVDHPLKDAAALVTERGANDKQLASKWLECQFAHLYHRPLQYEMYANHSALGGLLESWIHGEGIRVLVVDAPHSDTAPYAPLRLVDRVSAVGYVKLALNATGSIGGARAGAVSMADSAAEADVMFLQITSGPAAAGPSTADEGSPHWLRTQLQAAGNTPVVVVFVWDGTSTWPAATWSPWHKQQLQDALSHKAQAGPQDTSIIGVWFPFEPGATDGTPDQKFAATAAKVLEFHLVSAVVNVATQRYTAVKHR
jgi:hypothetical protein